MTARRPASPTGVGSDAAPDMLLALCRACRKIHLDVLCDHQAGIQHGALQNLAQARGAKGTAHVAADDRQALVNEALLELACLVRRDACGDAVDHVTVGL